MMTANALAVVCPFCRNDFSEEPGSLVCTECRRVFPIVAGIPDLRVEPDPWIGIEEDREKALRLQDGIRGLDFPAAVRSYWTMTPSTPPETASRFIEHVLNAEDRSREWLDGGRPGGSPGKEERWLDVGTGTADLIAAAPSNVTVVGLDVALRWLVVARRRLERRGLEARLVCGNAECLPFRDGSFDRVLSLGTLEHCRDPGAALREARRTTVSGGRLALRTVNRYTMLPEPHAGLWGVGWLPRRWADPYVRFRTGRAYQHHRPLGPRELRRKLERAGVHGVRVEAAPPLAAETRRLGSLGRRAVHVYDRLRKWPLVEPVLRTVAPILEAEGEVQ